MLSLLGGGRWQQGLQARMALVLRQGSQVAYCIIKRVPALALLGKQGLECGDPGVVGGLGGKAGVVGLGHPAVVAFHARALGQPALAQHSVTGAKILHCY